MAPSNDAVQAATTPTTLDFQLQNQTTSGTVYAYITGQAIDKDNALFLLKSDGKTAYYPASPSGSNQALGADCAIPLGAVGNSVTVTIPRLAGARLWFVRDDKLTFYLNSGPSLVEPSPSNTADANYNKYWDFCEFTFNDQQLYANISYVDFVSLPISLTLTTSSGQTKHVAGIPADGLDTICSGLTSQQAKDKAGWDKLIVKKGDANLRAVSPNTGITLNSGLFDNYYSSYVDQVWSKYASDSLTINTQNSSGNVAAKISNGELNFANGAATYGKPAAADIFSCSSGPFAVAGKTEKDAITARLAAAFNRSNLLTNTNTPDGDKVTDYYQNAVTNHYSRIVHAANLDSRGYAFPYDDVAPSDGNDQSGSVFDGSPKSLTVVVGGGTASKNGNQSKNTTGSKGPSNDAKTPTTTQPSQGAKKSINWKDILNFLNILKRLPCFK
ncbi:uncharacterized protein TRUGW13939_06239 [Talaromyces rugulosus]|uniref:GH64 domain-containing protein n=1 Tax=Talaromyces rugulosus TaxID=121627 RepID=A0A7H8QZK1_TALRU|nr:uncharacterized protein TRUGW13939_06239 [Talaromyces rugulosus]QKX59108.1 hypothetical protein TRUGW13939_06239 [Talaromyces rugulosus]